MSYARKMWFGTKQFSRWIKVHSPSSEYSLQGYASKLAYLNGGASIRRSLGGRVEINLAWNRVSSEEARQIADFASGAYGDAPFYLSDPVSQRQNVLNKAWAAPGLTAKEGIPLAGEDRPELVQNTDQSRGYPVDMAKYTLDGTDARRTFYVPIPPGHVAWVGIHGDTASTLGIRVQPTLAGVATGAPTSVAVAGVDTNTRASASFTPSGDQAGLELSIGPGVGTITLAAIIVQVLPAGVTPEPGDFISGQGASGLDFETLTAPMPYSLPRDRFGLAAKLVEVEQWQ